MTTSSAADCVPRPNLCVPTSERQERVRYKMSDLVQRLRQRSAKVVVVGQGYVGLPVAMRSVEVGFDVVGFDVSEQRVASLRAGESFVGDVSDDTLAAALAAGYKPTADAADLAEFDVAVLSVPTPLRDGAPDLSYIESAGRTLGGHLRAGACVILESTTYPGTTTELLGPILEQASGLATGEYYLGYSPERIDPGNETHTFVNTPKVTSGVDDASLAVVDAFFSALVDQTVPVGSPAEAELVKLLENTFRHVNIALVNELAMFARELDVDIWRAIDAASTKPFGYMRFTPWPRRRWPLPTHRPELPGMASQTAPRPDVPVCRTGQRRERTHARLCVQPGHSHAQRSEEECERQQGIAAGPGLQTRHQRLARKPKRRSRRTTRCRRRRGVRVRSAHRRGQYRTPGFPLVPFEPAVLGAADLVIVLVDHHEFDPARSPNMPRWCSTPRT